MKKAFKYILALAAVGLLVAGGGIAYMLYGPGTNMNTISADFNATATQLYEEYSLDEAAGNMKYIDKVIEVKGTIAEFIKDENGATAVVLRDEAEFSGVMCTLDEGAAKQLESLSEGDPVTIKGQCTGMLMDVVMKNCVVVK